MPKASSRASAPRDSADDIEAAFYDALQQGDLAKLMACWSDDDEVVCVHPGGPRVVGLAAIRASFEGMFANGAIRAWPQDVVRSDTLTTAVHSLHERVEVMTDEGPRHAWVIATNVYIKTAQGWRMVAHHASPAAALQVDAPTSGHQVLH